MDPENNKQSRYLESQNSFPSNNSQYLQKAYKHKEHNLDYRGEQIDRNLIQGPVKSRSCTNFICFLIFIGFFVGIGFLSIFSYAKGDIKRLGVPQDSYGNRCGVTKGFEHLPYIYFVDPLKKNSPFICMADCPSSDNNNIQNLKQYYLNKLTPSPKQYKAFQEGRTCVPYVYKNGKNIKDIQQPSCIYVSHLGDLRSSWPMLIGCIFLITFFGYVYLLLMRQWAGCMTWICILLYMLFLIVGGGMLYGQATQQGPYSDKSISSSKKTENILIGILLWIIAGISAIYICFNWKKINYAIAVLKCSVDYTRDYNTIFIFPLLITLVYVLFLIFWIYTVLTIYSSGEEKKKDIKGPYDYTKYDSTMQGLVVFHIIGFFWVSEYLVAFTQFVIANSTAMWYFYRDEAGNKKNMPGNLKTSIIRAIQHSGSLMFGSAITGIVFLVKQIFLIFHVCSRTERTKRHDEIKQSGRVVNPQCSCCIAFSNIYTAYLRYLQKSAYVQVAIAGKNFVPASHDSYYLMKRNSFYFSAMSGVGVMMIFIGKVFILGSNTFIAYLAIQNAPQIKDYILSSAFPTIFIGVASYFFGTIYVSLYGTSSDTILQCYCIEEELYNELRDEDQLRYQRQIPATLLQFLESNNLGAGKKSRSDIK